MSATLDTTKGTKKAHRERVLVNAHVRVNLWVPDLYKCAINIETYVKQLEDAAKAFEAFVRDHRHQDCQQVEVVREYRDQCSVCHCDWEPGYDPNAAPQHACCHCGAEIEL